MLETVARISRAVASEARLAMFAELANEPEVCPSDLASVCRMTRPVVASHLKVLTSAGLVFSRRSGPRIFYSLAIDSPGPEARSTSKLIRRAFRDPLWALRGCSCESLMHVTPELAGVSPQTLRVMDVIFDAATAFTNVRRLQIVRYLQTRGTARLSELVAELRMSPQAASRHADKLRRRGVLCVGEGRAGELGPGRVSVLSNFHREYSGMVLRTLSEANSGVS